MSDKLVKQGDDLVLVIGKSILKKLKMDKDTPLKIEIKDDAIVIRVRDQDGEKSHVVSDKEIDKIADGILEKYKSVFDKLSKS